MKPLVLSASSFRTRGDFLTMSTSSRTLRSRLDQIVSNTSISSVKGYSVLFVSWEDHFGHIMGRSTLMQRFVHLFVCEELS